MQALSTTDCPDEPHLFPVLVKMNTIFAKRASHACVEIRITDGMVS